LPIHPHIVWLPATEELISEPSKLALMNLGMGGTISQTYWKWYGQKETSWNNHQPTC